MLEHTRELSIVVFIFGAALVSAMAMKSICLRYRLPPLVGYLMLGVLLRLGNGDGELLPEQTPWMLELLGSIGIICLLFRVGVEAKLETLITELQECSLIWLSNIVVSGLAGFAVCYWVAGVDLVPSIVVGVALTATSIGIPVAIWRRKGLLKTPLGQRFIEVAELDDISAVVLMALLATVLPQIRSGSEQSVSHLLAAATGVFVVKFALFAGLCFLFSRFVEKPVTTFFSRVKGTPDPMLAVTGIGFMIAAVAGVLGFSVAVGAFFAGLAFSRDARAVRMKTSFESLYQLFTPFFFIFIGYQIPLGDLGNGLSLGFLLLFAAVLGKLIGTVPAARLSGTKRESWILGVSMVPRSEIALLIMQGALMMGEWACPREVFSAMVLVCATTSIAAPLVLNVLLTDDLKVKKTARSKTTKSADKLTEQPPVS